MKTPKCIIFDCDGVLVDSEPLAIQVLLDLSHEFGFQMDLDTAMHTFSGQSLPYCFQYIEKIIGTSLPADFETRYRHISFQRFEKEIKAVEGVKTFIESVKHLKLCIASSGPLEKIELNLKLTGLLHYFNSNIFSCYTLQKWKPDPAIFIYAANVMGFNKSDCIVIEDSEMGVKAALDGGFETFCYQKDKNKHLNSKVKYFTNFQSLSHLFYK
jgi:HAD superfamily hydrolase (TIGR01509 family)